MPAIIERRNRALAQAPMPTSLTPIITGLLKPTNLTFLTQALSNVASVELKIETYISIGISLMRKCDAAAAILDAKSAKLNLKSAIENLDVD